MTTLEVAANGLNAISIFLAGRNSIHTWWTGVVGCVLFALLFLNIQLYADSILQVFFIATCFIGWWQWLHGDDGARLPVTHLAWTHMAWQLALSVVVVLGYSTLLDFFTNDYAPLLDSTIFVFSVFAQLLMMRRHVECWPCWLLVNTIAIPLYWDRGLYVTAVLYALFWGNSLISWRSWHQFEKQSVEA